MKTLALILLASSVYAAVTVQLAPGVPATLQDALIADLTNQYKATVKPSGFFAGNFTVTIESRNGDYKPIDNATAFGECIAFGFSNGMDEERRANLETLVRDWDQAVEFRDLPVECDQAYKRIWDIIRVRNGMVFDPAGNIVAP